ncbi:hypothetical protein GCM10007276_12210 [Agaricicola taiwanensis]|uniref:Helix-turn-helix domain-containing protein n=1 Tax=Agaricicola taiwanensis TaxID=591372 RepID=A0A8J2VLG9_9RHOB|nr:hypothetical protein [Agaricicola taiwanensis]GGE36281.1 hypothetical protein GCM10007276_12210 [Agaricicola taiwanensis]
MPAGRPTTYDPRYCEEVVDFMSQGFSLTAFAGHIRCARSTINEWMAVHEEFSEAVKIGQATRTAKLEKTLIDGETGPKVTAHIFALKNAAPEEWKDKVQQELTGDGGGPINHSLQVTFVKPGG